ncbi:MAG TPA: hypothetical protein PLI09_22790 [Candidatus Hydrogenedentes bacterium]|nr:hypothetical protein [Candidatus Hydrogenedentota bacterium]
MRQGTMLSLIILSVFCLSGCDSGPFTMTVTPESTADAIPNQRCVFLTWINNDDNAIQSLLPVTLTVTAPGAQVLIEPSSVLYPGEMAEITAIPMPLVDGAKQIPGPEEGRFVDVKIHARRGNYNFDRTLPILVTSEEEDTLGPAAAVVLDNFVPWLAANYPELNINDQTQWTNSIVTPHILIVSHYLFFSEEWEVHVFWHVMIPPYDWARIELRKRYSEFLPSMAFEIPSLSAETIQIYPIEPSDTLWR